MSPRRWRTSIGPLVVILGGPVRITSWIVLLLPCSLRSFVGSHLLGAKSKTIAVSLRALGDAVGLQPNTHELLVHVLLSAPMCFTFLLPPFILVRRRTVLLHPSESQSFSRRIADGTRRFF